MNKEKTYFTHIRIYTRKSKRYYLFNLSLPDHVFSEVCSKIILKALESNQSIYFLTTKEAKTLPVWP